ncbi:MAG: stage II sporulation protein M [Candidatus Obscuribacterales bacterium]|nr:stage II sporulation protein M [Candidatus Obscuribacterales bacterium]
MNVERWVAGRQLTWQKLEDLLKQAEKKSLASLTREQLQSLGRLYRSAASDLSRARAMGLGPDITAYLNNLVVKGHNQVYQSPKNRWKDLAHFLWITFPAVYRNNIIYVVIAFFLFAIPMVGTWSMVMNDVKIARLELQPGVPLVSDELFSYVENKKMWTDAAQHESPAASSFIATNNIKVCLLSFVGGITFGLLTLYILVTNGMSIGGTFAACQLHDMAVRLAQFVAPHGVFELSAIWISGGAGLLVAKGMLFPGKYKMSDSIRIASRPAFAMFAGCIPLLLIAGTIEGFISPRTDLTQEVKYLVSVSTLFVLLLYLFVPRKWPEQNPNPEIVVTVPDSPSASGTPAKPTIDKLAPIKPDSSAIALVKLEEKV